MYPLRFFSGVGFCSFFLLLIILSRSVCADASKGEADAVATLRKAQGMLRQLSQDKSQLETKLASIEQEFDEKRKAYDALQAELAQKLELLLALQKNVDVLTKNNSILKNNIDSLRLANDKLRQEYSSAHVYIDKLSSDNSLLVGAVKERETWIASCAAKNKDLIVLHRRIIDEYDDGGFIEKFARMDPVTGIGSVERENKTQDYKYRLQELSVTPWDGGAGR